MAPRIVDAVAYELSRVLESIFDAIEYQFAKSASARMAKQRRKARRRLPGSNLRSYEFQRDHSGGDNSGKTTDVRV